ncbi:GAF and ANTAR domain-containing protein [Streptomyces katrae]|uniref:GAF and ANTAR domain-containing protein n=1 Tax=Streptomyces katrae TaxID=68223 RepID=UPI000ABF3E4A|nr:GAF and ANTAR domain-containing protein [Streptomyces katrae]
MDPVHPDDVPAGGSAPLPQGEEESRLHGLFSGAVDGAAARDVPAALCRACVDLMDVTGASVSLSGEDPEARTLWWSSDDVAGRLAEAQYTLGDGPCVTALTHLAPVLAADLTRGPDAVRWPVFAQQAVELGVRAVFSLPLALSAVAIGTLDLYRDRTGPLSEEDRAFAFPAADAITTALLAVQAQDDLNGLGGSWLDEAETDHEEAHQATGMIMVHLGVDPHYALARLRAHAFANGQTVTEAAFDVIAGRIRFHD